MALTHGSLFAGIGGFDRGFEGVGFETIWQVEIDEYCQRVLAHHFPDARRYDDVRTVHGSAACPQRTAHAVASGRLENDGYKTAPSCGQCLATTTVLTGGFPCQDISYAGKGAGLAGSCSGLWTEFLLKGLGNAVVPQIAEEVAWMIRAAIEQP